MERKISIQARGYLTTDGAGVNLVRVLGSRTVEDFDPFLMLDSFDSTNPEEYKAGFPMHPHRGIETISYVYRGAMAHKDSLGNEDTIGNGEVQWMTAGSGIMHEENLPARNRLLGVQLWLNLPAKDKMADPAYHSIKSDDIDEFAFPWGKLRLLAGSYQNLKGFMGAHLPLDYYDLHLNPGASVQIDTKPERAVMLFTLQGDAIIAGELIKEKTAVKLTAGDTVEVKATAQKAQVLFLSSMALSEPVIWGGPIVMNTKAELHQAFDDLKNNKFVQHEIAY